jgi:hypothetical protein
MPAEQIQQACQNLNVEDINNFGNVGARVSLRAWHVHAMWLRMKISVNDCTIQTGHNVMLRPVQLYELHIMTESPSGNPVIQITKKALAEWH